MNARVSWQGIKLGSTTLKLSGYVKNLADTHAPNFSASSGQWDPQPPRTYGLEASLDF
jgi:outer membrane receptor protein involved in Fe transport